MVPNIEAASLDESRAFYVRLLGFEVGMDQGWIVGFVSPTNPTAQVQVSQAAEPRASGPHLTIEVGDVDHVYAKAQESGAEIVYPLTDESWGVRRFFVTDPNGVVINVMSHLPPT